MKSEKKFVYAVLVLIFLISACQDEKTKNDYSGVSNIIASRNKARYDEAENFSKKNVSTKTSTDEDSTSKPASTSKEKELSSIILYEEKVKIVGVESDRTLAKGVAYINKKGQIVRIKILKD